MSKFDLTVGNDIVKELAHSFRKALTMGTIRSIVGSEQRPVIQVHVNILSSPTLIMMPGQQSLMQSRSMIELRELSATGGEALSTFGFLDIARHYEENVVPVFHGRTSIYESIYFRIHRVDPISINTVNAWELAAHEIDQP